MPEAAARTEPEVPEAFQDLLDAPVAVLATVGASGRPQLSAIWFLAEDGQLGTSLNTVRQKAENLRRDPACTLFILDPSGYRYLEIRADAELIPDPDYAYAGRLGAKYGGMDLHQMDKPGEVRVAVRLHPARIRAVNMADGQ